MHFPSARIDVAVDARWAPLLVGHQAIGHVYPIERPRNWLRRLRVLSKAVWTWRSVHYDVVLNFHASRTTAWLSRLSGAPVRSIHLHGLKDRNLFSTVHVPGKGMVRPIIERDLDVVRALGCVCPDRPLPSITVSKQESIEAQRRLQDIFLAKPQRLLGVALGASRPAKSWPIERFAKAAVEWCRQEDGCALALAGPGESALRSEWERCLATFLPAEDALRRRIEFVDDLSLRGLASVLGQCSVLLGNDSGPRHLAVAVGTPTVTLFGPEDPFEWHPYPVEEHPYFFLPSLICRKDALPGMRPWCGVENCSQSHRCMQDIPVLPVVEACQKVSRK